MKAISVHQPWAELIRQGRKTIELRRRTTHYRGPIVIVSTVRKPDPDLCERFGLDPAALPLGTARCVVELFDSRPAVDADSDGACCGIESGEESYLLGTPIPCEPVRVRGQQGWYDVPSDSIRPRLREGA